MMWLCLHRLREEKWTHAENWAKSPSCFKADYLRCYDHGMEGPLAHTKAPVINVLFYSQLSIASQGHTATKQNLRVYTFQNILNNI